jgi:hypothetical protein
MTSDQVRFRLLRADDVPATNPHNLPFKFGLQDKHGEIIPATPQKNGSLAFDFTLTVKEGADPERPVFGGRFANGPPNDRFVYLSWYAMQRGDYINRVKARLSSIDWQMVRTAQASNKAITADMTGWTPGHTKKKYIEWHLT